MAEFIPFNFSVEFHNEAKGQKMCEGQFSEVQGLEVSMEPYVIPVGGRNYGQVQRVGATTFAPLVFKRGITSNDDLWNWFDMVNRRGNYNERINGVVNVKGNQRDEQGNTKTLVSWHLSNVMPTRFKAPDLSATATQVALEELAIVFEDLSIKRPA